MGRGSSSATSWRASLGEITISDVIAAHGYHGPLEGEISSRVWREEPQPLHRLVEGYRGKGDAENPSLLREEEARRRLPGLQRELVAQLPRAQRVPAGALLRYAARTLPLRGVGKASFLQALDVARASARRIGVLLAERAALDVPEDVFYMTTTELARVPEPAQLLVAQRRRNRHHHQQLTLPASWRGTPDAQTAPDPDAGDTTRLITGIGVSAGTVEGSVRLAGDPSFTDVEPGEVLVAPTTDPSWTSIMFLSSALVVDIGGALSHAAVVARELGIPCGQHPDRHTSAPHRRRSAGRRQRRHRRVAQGREPDRRQLTRELTRPAGRP